MLPREQRGAPPPRARSRRDRAHRTQPSYGSGRARVLREPRVAAAESVNVTGPADVGPSRSGEAPGAETTRTTLASGGGVDGRARRLGPHEPAIAERGRLACRRRVAHGDRPRLAAVAVQERLRERADDDRLLAVRATSGSPTTRRRRPAAGTRPRCGRPRCRSRSRTSPAGGRGCPRSRRSPGRSGRRSGSRRPRRSSACIAVSPAGTVAVEEHLAPRSRVTQSEWPCRTAAAPAAAGEPAQERAGPRRRAHGSRQGVRAHRPGERRADEAVRPDAGSPPGAGPTLRASTWRTAPPRRRASRGRLPERRGSSPRRRARGRASAGRRSDRTRPVPEHDVAVLQLDLVGADRRRDAVHLEHPAARAPGRRKRPIWST